MVKLVIQTFQHMGNVHFSFKDTQISYMLITSLFLLKLNVKAHELCFP